MQDFLTWITLDTAAIIGYIAGAVGIGAFLLAKRESLLLARVITDLLFALHYFLINAISGAYLSIIYVFAVVLALLSDKLSKRQETLIRLVICVAGGFLVYQSYQGVQDILALIATWISFFMYGIKCNARLRWVAFLIVNPLWLIYAIASASLPGTLTLIAYQIATALGLYRIHRDSKKDVIKTD